MNALRSSKSAQNAVQHSLRRAGIEIEKLSAGPRAAVDEGDNIEAITGCLLQETSMNIDFLQRTTSQNVVNPDRGAENGTARAKVRRTSHTAVDISCSHLPVDVAKWR